MGRHHQLFTDIGLILEASHVFVFVSVFAFVFVFFFEFIIAFVFVFVNVLVSVFVITAAADIGLILASFDATLDF